MDAASDLASDDASIAQSQEHWRAIRRYLNEHRHEFTQAAVQLYPDALRVGPTALLTRADWLPRAPVSLDQVKLVWEPHPPAAVITGAEVQTQHVRPRRDDGHRFESYSDAVAELQPPRVFENRMSYRLLDVDLQCEEEEARLTFTTGSYFDSINVSEAVAHELAAAHQSEARHRLALRALPFREAIGDPCDPGRRSLLPALSALTLRRDRAGGEASIVLHWRDPTKVAHGGGLYQVIPVGIFQPSADAAWNERNDFDLWRCLLREYQEEFLGGSEDYGSKDAPINYEAWPFFHDLAQARRNGRIRVYWLGLGVDPLTMATDMLMVVVIDDDIFDTILGRMVATNDEGRVVNGFKDDSTPSVGIPFRDKIIDQFVQDEPMQAAGSAVLHLAWQHRDLLLGR